jgi:glycerophosphoryl diester phosphodiesterase
MKRLFTMLAVLLLLCCLAFCALAAEDGGLVAVSFRGDTSAAPANSPGAIAAAFDAGADWVSVSVQRTQDGAFVLLEDAPLPLQCDTDLTSAADCDLAQLQTLHYRFANGTVSDEPVATLEQALALAVGKGGLILDNAWAFRDEINALIGARSVVQQVCLRTLESAKKALQWQQDSGALVSVLPVYKGNVVMNAIAHWNRLSTAKMPLVQFQSKNYFNVFYQKFTDRRFSAVPDVHALAPMYDKTLCGLRGDDAAGWDDLISRGFSAVETGNIRGLAAYLAQCKAERAALEALLRQEALANPDACSSLSADRLEKACREAQSALGDPHASLSRLQSAESELQSALRLLMPKGEKDTQKGCFVLTPGRLAVIVIFGALLLGFDLFVYRKKKKT